MNRILAVAVLFLVVDIAVTGLFWHLEMNPLAREFGMFLFLSIKTTMILPFAAVYLRYRPVMPRRANLFAGTVGSLYAIAAVSNLWVILS